MCVRVFVMIGMGRQGNRHACTCPEYSSSNLDVADEFRRCWSAYFNKYYIMSCTHDGTYTYHPINRTLVLASLSMQNQGPQLRPECPWDEPINFPAYGWCLSIFESSNDKNKGASSNILQPTSSKFPHHISIQLSSILLPLTHLEPRCFFFGCKSWRWIGKIKTHMKKITRYNWCVCVCSSTKVFWVVEV